MSRQTWWEKHDFPPMMDAYNSAKALAWGVNALEAPIREEFNNTPMVAYRGDTAQLIMMRWHYQRLLYQIKDGTININDIVLEEMPK